MKRLMAAAAIVVAVAGVSAYVAAAQGSSKATVKLSAHERAELAQLSFTRRPITLPPGSRADELSNAGYGPFAIVGAVGTRDILQIGRRGASACYGAGSANAVWPIGWFKCPSAKNTFPSASYPILDLSLSGRDASDGQMHFIDVTGLAADGVKSVKVLDTAGAVLASVPVVRNVYDSGSTSLGATAVKLEAVDASGNVLATIPRQ